MEEANLPEEIIVLILTYLPVKPLIQFTCVSKRFHSLILSDPKFAKSQFQAARDRKTFTQRLLYTPAITKLESLDLDSTSFRHRSALRNHPLPFLPAADSEVLPLGSCNGIVFLAFDDKLIYAWNPSTNFFKKLPDLVFTPSITRIGASGVCYLPATDDYRVFVVFESEFADDDKKEVALFSSKAKAWETLGVDFNEVCFASIQGTLVNEALHWLDTRKEIVAFDLGQEEEDEFRTMSLPRVFRDSDGFENHLGVAAGGCLCLARKLYVCGDCVDIWVMGEYGVCDSWSKRFSFKFSHPPSVDWTYGSVLVLETCMVAEMFLHKRYKIGRGLVKIGQKEEEECSIYKDEGDWLYLIHYQESLIRIED